METISKLLNYIQSDRLLGAIFYTLTVSLFVAANKLTTAANAILLQYTAPIYVALFSNWFLGEKVSLVDWLAIFVVISGMTLFFMDQLSSSGMWGNIFAIASGISFAWLTLVMRQQKASSPLQTLFWGNLLTALALSPFVYSAPSLTFKSSLSLLLLGVIQLSLPYILYAKAQEHVKALEVILIFMVEPLLNPVWVLLVMGEKPALWSLLGGLVILCAISVRGIILALKSRHFRA